jgi:hypothetical protein
MKKCTTVYVSFSKEFPTAHEFIHYGFCGSVFDQPQIDQRAAGFPLAEPDQEVAQDGYLTPVFGLAFPGSLI